MFGEEFDLDSTGHVYMIDPHQQELENDYHERKMAEWERSQAEVDHAS